MSKFVSLIFCVIKYGKKITGTNFCENKLLRRKKWKSEVVISKIWGIYMCNLENIFSRMYFCKKFSKFCKSNFIKVTSYE